MKLNEIEIFLTSLLFFYSAMSTNSNKQDDLGPKGRNRSSSATESSKPNSTYRKPQINSGGIQKPHIFSQGKHFWYQNYYLGEKKNKRKNTPTFARSFAHIFFIYIKYKYI